MILIDFSRRAECWNQRQFGGKSTGQCLETRTVVLVWLLITNLTLGKPGRFLIPFNSTPLPIPHLWSGCGEACPLLLGSWRDDDELIVPSSTFIEMLSLLYQEVKKVSDDGVSWSYLLYHHQPRIPVFIHSLIQQRFMEQLPCGRGSSRHWEQSSKQGRPFPSVGAYIPVKHTHTHAG